MGMDKAPVMEEPKQEEEEEEEAKDDDEERQSVHLGDINMNAATTLQAHESRCNRHTST